MNLAVTSLKDEHEDCRTCFAPAEFGVTDCDLEFNVSYFCGSCATAYLLQRLNLAGVRIGEIEHNFSRLSIASRASVPSLLQ